MKTIEKKVSLSAGPGLARLCPQGRPLFFDIETTGISPDRSQLYLIGCCYPEGDSWEFIQWFAQGPGDEGEVIARFEEFAGGFSLLVHFNGDHFDLPYLHRKAERFGVPDRLSDLSGVDLYKKIRPCKNFMGMPNCRLKTIQAFLGLQKEDKYNGGQLIDIYREYVRRPDSRKERLLLLHNEEDILGMPELLPVLAYPDFLGGNFSLEEVADREESEEGTTFLFRLSFSFPCPVFFREEGWKGIIRGNMLRLTLPRLAGELKYFLPDYKDYYYLPAEDTAVHKSVAAYVDKAFRRKATARTGYLRREGSFLKLPGDMGRRVFRPDYGGDCYLEEYDPAFADPAFLEQYLKRLVCLLH